MNLRIYCKFSDQARFKAMDWANGYQVDNLLYATVIDTEDRGRAESALERTAKINPGTEFQLRTTDKNNKVVYSIKY